MKGMRNQMKLTMLGAGNAMVTECYNTCFVISDKEKYFMVDGGGGNAVLRQLKHAGFSAGDMKEIFVTHKHMATSAGDYMDDQSALPAGGAGTSGRRGNDLCP